MSALNARQFDILSDANANAVYGLSVGHWVRLLDGEVKQSEALGAIQDLVRRGLLAHTCQDTAHKFNRRCVVNVTNLGRQATPSR